MVKEIEGITTTIVELVNQCNENGTTKFNIHAGQEILAQWVAMRVPAVHIALGNVMKDHQVQRCQYKVPYGQVLFQTIFFRGAKITFQSVYLLYCNYSLFIFADL